MQHGHNSQSAVKKPNLQNEGTRKIVKSPGILPKFSGMYTYQRELNEKEWKAGLTDLENQMEQAEFAAGHLINIKIAIDSLLLKDDSHMKKWELQMK